MTSAHGPASDAAERVDTDAASPWYAEHRSRYLFATERVAGRSVLDIACGTGYGARVLHDAGAKLVVGVDNSLEPLRVARQREGVRCLLRGEASGIPLRSNAVDVVTCFESVEHVQADEKFVAELRRVLKPDGALLLSTPNALHTKPVNGVPSNPYHVREYSPRELTTLLERHFQSVEMLGQAPSPCYGFCPYWQRPENLPTDFKSRLGVLSWKAFGRLPQGLRDALEWLFRRRAYYPSEKDFTFDAALVDAGHVLLAVCSGSRNGD
ncbi:MAG: class I SAM-dependent methyltransferase [Actinomycetota bacterium]|nr:class I SAM-dependent methyltransferase [Actinomycetota bacterium]